MWDFLFGWMIGRGIRNAGLPDSVKQKRYDARQARRQSRKASRQGQWSTPFGHFAIWFAAICVFVVIVAAIAK